MLLQGNGGLPLPLESIDACCGCDGYFSHYCTITFYLFISSLPSLLFIAPLLVLFLLHHYPLSFYCTIITSLHSICFFSLLSLPRLLLSLPCFSYVSIYLFRGLFVKGFNVNPGTNIGARRDGRHVDDLRKLMLCKHTIFLALMLIAEQGCS